MGQELQIKARGRLQITASPGLGDSQVDTAKRHFVRGRRGMKRCIVRAARASASDLLVICLSLCLGVRGAELARSHFADAVPPFTMISKMLRHRSRTGGNRHAARAPVGDWTRRIRTLFLQLPFVSLRRGAGGKTPGHYATGTNRYFKSAIARLTGAASHSRHARRCLSFVELGGSLGAALGARPNPCRLGDDVRLLAQDRETAKAASRSNGKQP